MSKKGIFSAFKKPWERDDSRDSFSRGKSNSFKKPWEHDDDNRKSFGGKKEKSFDSFKKPWERDDDNRKSFGGKKEKSFGGFKKPWERDDDRKSFGKKKDRPFESKKPWERNDDRKSFGGKKEKSFGGFKKPWERDDDRKSFNKKEKSFGNSSKKPWERDDLDMSFDDFSPKKPAKPWEKEEKSFDKKKKEEKPSKVAVPQIPDGELIFGRQPVLEVLRANRRIVKQLIIADSVKENEDIDEAKELCDSRAIKILKHKRETLDAWLNSANHQGICAVCEEYPYTEIDEIYEIAENTEGNLRLVILDHVVDPQNLGSLLRSCEAAGVAGVVIPSDRAVGVTPAAVRASAGAAEHLKIACVPNIVQVIERLKKLNVWTTGLEALPESKPYTEIDFKGKVCIVVGSEGQGLSRLVRESCDYLAVLPMFGKVSSLNAGVAGALAIYEVIRQQQGSNE